MTVSNLVGHSMPSTTINMYAHAVSERKARAVEAVGQMYDEMMGKNSMLKIGTMTLQILEQQHIFTGTSAPLHLNI